MPATSSTPHINLVVDQTTMFISNEWQKILNTNITSYLLHKFNNNSALSYSSFDNIILTIFSSLKLFLHSIFVRTIVHATERGPSNTQSCTTQHTSITNALHNTHIQYHITIPRVDPQFNCICRNINIHFRNTCHRERTLH